MRDQTETPAEIPVRVIGVAEIGAAKVGAEDVRVEAVAVAVSQIPRRLRERGDFDSPKFLEAHRFVRSCARSVV